MICVAIGWECTKVFEMDGSHFILKINEFLLHSFTEYSEEWDGFSCMIRRFIIRTCRVSDMINIAICCRMLTKINDPAPHYFADDLCMPPSDYM
jgi:hypothetical protein